MRPSARTLVVAAMLAGCHVFDESLLDRQDGSVDADPDDPDATGDVDAAPPQNDAGPGCALRRPPERPPGMDTEDDGQAFYALREIELDQSDEWVVSGYDLDGICTTPPDLNVECVPPARSGQPEIDGEGGTDNVFGHQVIPLVLLGYPQLSQDTMYTQTRGINALLVRIAGWNGEANDPRVDVTIAQSVYGTQSNAAGDGPAVELPPGDVPLDEGGYPDVPEPRWDGSDYWFARDDLFLDGDMDRPRIRDDNAYLRDGVLVVQLPDRFPISFTGVTIGTVFRLTDAVFTMQLAPDLTHVERGILAGRWAILDMLDTAPTASICPGTDDYSQFARVLDLAADIRSTPGTGGPRVLCDALSVGIRFNDGVRAKLGGLHTPYPLPTPCEAPDGGT